MNAAHSGEQGPARGLGSRLLDLPATRSGVASIALGIVFGACVAAFQVMMRSGRIHGGPSFFSDPAAAALMVGAAVAALAGGVTALFAVIVRRERSLLVIAMIAIGAFVAVFVGGRLASTPH